jgi:integrase
MSRPQNLLTQKQVDAAPDGWHSDGGNLYLRVDGSRRRWILRYAKHGRTTEMGLGGADRVSLAAARKLRDQHLETLALGRDPKAVKRAQKTRRTFAEVAAEVIAERRDGWRVNESGRETSLTEWTKSLVVDAKPLGPRFVDEIEVADVKRVVTPAWNAGLRSTARRTLSRLESVFDYAKAHGLRQSDNPASWAVFRHVLQAPKGNGGKQPHPALDWRAMPAFMAKLRAVDSMPARAVELMILTAARSGEVRQMKWSEVDFDKAVWTCPGERMKREKEHAVPLSSDALALLERIRAARIPGPHVFPGPSGEPITNHTPWELVAQLTEREATVHGFRSSFRSWCSAQKVSREIAERCLAHARENQVEAAYDREELVELRRPVMQSWADFLAGRDAAKVVKLPTKRRA